MTTDTIDAAIPTQVEFYYSPVFWTLCGLGVAILLVVVAVLKALQKATRELAVVAEERDAAITEAREATTARRTMRFQTMQLASLLPGTNPEETLNRFLKVILPRLTNGYAVIVDRVTSPAAIIMSRGVLPESTDLNQIPVQVDKSWAAGRVCPGAYLVPINERYVLLTSQLAPSDIPVATARSILEESCLSIATHADAVWRERSENTELRMTREMLALHEIADRVTDNPDAVLRDYLQTLLAYQPFDRVALYLIHHESESQSMTRIGHAGRDLIGGTAEAAVEHETRLALVTTDGQKHFNRSELESIGVGSLFASALTLELERGGQPCGILCLTSARTVTRDATETRLLKWVARHLVVLLETLRDRLSMERRATRDGLTGLYNRAELDRRLELAVERADEANPCTLILFDLDRFKSVNDTYGHAAGDEAIRHVAKLMQAVALNSRADDEIVVARYGGEELCVLMPKGNMPASLRIAEQIRKDVATTVFRHDDRIIPLTISAGVAAAPLHGNSSAQVLATADACLYTSKQLGRNRVTEAGSIESIDKLKNSIDRRS